ncbi:MAG: transposase [Thermoflexus sp.]
MPGSPQANYKAIQRFLAETNPKEALWRLYHEEAPFVLVDVTEIPRPQARRTSYVGRLRDGKTRGFWLLLLATPYRGRAIPFSFVTYSSQTIDQSGSSRNLEHRRALREVRELVGDKPLVMDREFSYGGLLETLQEAGMHFVIRLNASRHPTFTGEDGEERTLTIAPGERKIYQGLYYQGKVRVNVAGEWRKGLEEPLWVITDLEPEKGLAIYRQRMKIEECFKDLKDLLSLAKIMNKKQENMEKMVAMVLMAYAFGLLVGEELRDLVYGPGPRDGGFKSAEDPLRGEKSAS